MTSTQKKAASEERQTIASSSISQVRDFLQAIFGTAKDGFINICHFVGPNPRSRWFSPDQIGGAAEYATSLAEKYNVYFGLGTHDKDLGPYKRGSAKEVAGIYALWVEIDTADGVHSAGSLPTREEAKALLERFPLKPSAIVDSSGGYHCYWFLDTTEVYQSFLDDMREAQDVMKRLQYIFIGWARENGWNMDNTSDLARVLRVPGTLNHKGDVPKPVEIVQIDRDLRYSRQSIVEAINSVTADLFDNSRLNSGSNDGIKDDWNDVGWAEMSTNIPDAQRPELIVDGCKFIKQYLEHKEEANYHEWVAAGSIAAFCNDGDTLFHEWSVGHGGYDQGVVDRKFKEIREKMSPRTCASLNQEFGKCGGCPHFGTINSPITLGMRDKPRDMISNNIGVKFDTGDKGNAERLTHIYADRIRHCVGNWFLWDGRRWKRDESNAVFLLAQKVSEFIEQEEIGPIMASLSDYDRTAIKMSQKKDLTPEQLDTKGVLESLRKQAERAKSDQGIRAMLSQAAPAVSIPVHEQNPDDGFINVENGLLRWKTGELFPHSSGRFSTVLIPVNYDPSADCPNIKKFFTDVLPEDSIRAMVEFFGYSLVPSARYKKAALLTGEGNNGKSKLLDLYTLFVGSENKSNQSLQDLEHNRFSRAQLFGKLANVYADIPATRLESSDVFKIVVSGDDLSAEYKGRDSFSFKPYAKLIFSANEKPSSRDVTEGFFNRWLIFDFPNKFVPGVNADPHIMDKIGSPIELSGLLNLALNGLHRLGLMGGFTISDSMNAHVEEYRREADSTIQFVAECCTIHDDNTRVDAQTLYNEFRSWCRENGYSNPMTSTTFGKKMSSRFRKVRSNGAHYIGLSIRYDASRLSRDRPFWTG